MYDLDFKTSGADKDPALMLSGDELLALYAKICDDFPVATIEDPFDQVRLVMISIVFKFKGA